MIGGLSHGPRAKLAILPYFSVAWTAGDSFQLAYCVINGGTNKYKRYHKGGPKGANANSGNSKVMTIWGHLINKMKRCCNHVHARESSLSSAVVFVI